MNQSGSVSLSSLPTGLSLKANFSWIFAGNLVYAACQWGILIILAKMASPEKVGQFALGLAVTAPVVMFTNLKLRDVQATDARQEFSFSDYLTHRCLAVLFAAVVIGLIVFFSYQGETALVIIAVGLAKLIESISDIFFGLFQSRERMDRIGKSLLIKGPLSLLVLGVVLYLTESAFWAAIALAASWGSILTLYDIPGGHFIRELDKKNGQQPVCLAPKWDLKAFGRLTALAFPLGCSMMLLSLYHNIPRYFIEYYQGEHDLGIFAAMAYLVIAGMTVVHALGQSVTPRLARCYLGDDRRGFYTLLGKLCVVGLLIGIAGILLAVWFGKEILTLLYRSEYAEHGDVFIWLMITATISYVANFLGFGVTATRAFHRQIVPFINVVLVTIICSMWFVPEYGIMGAAWAMAAANLANTLLFIYVLVSLENKPVSSS